MTHGERRRSVRRRAEDDHGIVSTRIRPGYPARLIDVSAGGVLLETPHRLLPGRAVELQIDGRGQSATIRGCVVRSMVARVRAASVSYRGAIAFERTVPWLAEATAPDGYGVPASESSIARERAAVTQSVL
jgi:hypothetical protein